MGTSFTYLQRDLPDTKTHERRELYVDATVAGAIDKNYLVDTADGKTDWRVVSTGIDDRGKLGIEIHRQLSKD